MPGRDIALCAAIAIDAGHTAAPTWVHLLPAGEAHTRDGRGPYRIENAAALMAASLARGDRLVMDENHSTDLVAPRGGEAPARGWIVELQQRADGIWGRVEWTAQGRRLVEAREYRGVSPVITHRKDGTVTQILRASLVNQPNMKGLTSLHMTSGPVKMDDIDHAIAVRLGIDPKRYLELLAGSMDFRRAIEPMRRQFVEDGVRLVPDEAVPVSAAHHVVIKMMGLDQEEYRRTLADQGQSMALHMDGRASGKLSPAQERVIALMGMDREQYRRALAAQGLSEAR